MTASNTTKTQNEIIRNAIIARYGDLRSAILRTLYTWLNLTLVIVLGWPALVVFVDAPDANPQDMPAGWFLIRFGILVATAGLLARFWYVNRLPTDEIQLSSVTVLFRRGKIWPQAILFLLGLTIMLSIILLIRSPGAAAKVLTLGGASALVIQGLNTGYVYSIFRILEVERRRVRGLVVALMGLTFASTAAIDAGIAVNSDNAEIAIAFFAGAGLGLMVGIASVFLRERSESLAPATLGQMLVFSIVPAFFLN